MTVPAKTRAQPLIVQHHWISNLCVVIFCSFATYLFGQEPGGEYPLFVDPNDSVPKFRDDAFPGLWSVASFRAASSTIAYLTTSKEPKEFILVEHFREPYKMTVGDNPVLFLAADPDQPLLISPNTVIVKTSTGTFDIVASKLETLNISRRQAGGHVFFLDGVTFSSHRGFGFSIITHFDSEGTRVFELPSTDYIRHLDPVIFARHAAKVKRRPFTDTSDFRPMIRYTLEIHHVIRFLETERLLAEGRQRKNHEQGKIRDGH